jgi:hypothetical protein
MIKQITILFLLAFNVFGEDYYLWKDGGNASPYSSKANAATNIHDAIGLLGVGDTLYMYEGEYWLTNNLNNLPNNTSYLGMETDIEKVSINFGTNNIYNATTTDNVKWANITFQNLLTTNLVDNGRGYFNFQYGGVFTNLLFKNNKLWCNPDGTDRFNTLFSPVRSSPTVVNPAYIDTIRIVSNSFIDAGNHSGFNTIGANSGTIAKNIILEHNYIGIKDVSAASSRGTLFAVYMTTNCLLDNIIVRNNTIDVGVQLVLIDPHTYISQNSTVKNMYIKNNIFGDIDSSLTLLGIAGETSNNDPLYASYFENIVITDNFLPRYDQNIIGANISRYYNLKNLYIKNNTVHPNTSPLVRFRFVNSTLENSTLSGGNFAFSDNSGGGGNLYKNLIVNGVLTIDLVNGTTTTYSYVSSISSPSTIDENTIIGGDFNSVFVDYSNNDYTIKSEAGGWDEQLGTWVYSDSTSPTVDTGDPTDDASGEPYYNGGVINIGYYGGTPKAAKSLGATFHGITEMTNKIEVIFPEL